MKLTWKKSYNGYLPPSLFMITLLAVLGLFIIWPAINKILAIKEEIEMEKVSLENKLSRGLNAKKIKEELLGIENSLSVLDVVFIQPNQELDLLGNIESLAAKNQVEVKLKPNFAGQNIGGNILRIPLDIMADGNFNNLISFLNDLDSSPFYYIGKELSFDAANNGKTNLTINGEVYMKKSMP
jgi:Tfp pilus assembly protein PilO